MTKTALITGASSGIGAEFARQLAAQKYDLILVARREERLLALSNELNQKYGVRTEMLIADLSLPADIERVEQCIASCETLALLVNNAGFGIPGSFYKIDIHKTLSMIEVMVVAVVRLSRAALPGMVAKGHGGIINISSVAAFVPTQGNSTYAAAKAYLNAFTEALAAELIGTGVKVQALCPGFTTTEFHDVGEYEGKNARAKIPKFLWMRVERVVAASLEAFERGRVYCIPGRGYWLAAALGRIGLAPFLGYLLRRFRK